MGVVTVARFDLASAISIIRAVATASLVIFPASISDCLSLYVAVPVVDSPGSSPVFSNLIPLISLMPSSESSIFQITNLQLPVFVTLNLYSISCPAMASSAVILVGFDVFSSSILRFLTISVHAPASFDWTSFSVTASLPVAVATL